MQVSLSAQYERTKPRRALTCAGDVENGEPYTRSLVYQANPSQLRINPCYRTCFVSCRQNGVRHGCHSMGAGAGSICSARGLQGGVIVVVKGGVRLACHSMGSEWIGQSKTVSATERWSVEGYHSTILSGMNDLRSV